MTGKQIKEKLRSIGVNLTELSDKLGFDSSQRLHSALKSDDVKSGLMEKIAKAIGRDMAWFYIDDNDYHRGGGDSASLSEINSSLKEIISILKNK